MHETIILADGPVVKIKKNYRLTTYTDGPISPAYAIIHLMVSPYAKSTTTQ